MWDIITAVIIESAETAHETVKTTQLAENPALTYICAIAMLLFASLLILLELAIVSGGLLGVLAIFALGTGCYLGFQVGPLAGLSCVILAPILGFFSVRIGLNRVQKTSLVSSTEITVTAGYHHTARAAGADIGAIGTLLSDAMPTGRAQFGNDGVNGEVNVVVQGSAGEKGQSIQVTAIDGTSIKVIIVSQNIK